MPAARLVRPDAQGLHLGEHLAGQINVKPILGVVSMYLAS